MTRLPNEGSSIHVDTGLTVARCVTVALIGRQENTYEGRTRIQDQILITWELSDYPMDDDMPLTISKRFTYVVSDRSNYYKMLNSWSPKGLSVEKAKSYDPKRLLGKPCLLDIGLSSKGRPVVERIMTPVDPRTKQNIPIPKPKNELVLYDIQEHDQEMFEKLWPWLQEQIKASPDWHSYAQDKAGEENQDALVHTSKEQDDDFFDSEEEEPITDPSKVPGVMRGSQINKPKSGLLGGQAKDMDEDEELPF